MTKFIINKGMRNEKPIEADSYRKDGEFVEFVQDASPIFTVRAAGIVTIELEKEAA